jgi:hypothetical protein
MTVFDVAVICARRSTLIVMANLSVGRSKLWAVVKLPGSLYNRGIGHQGALRAIRISVMRSDRPRRRAIASSWVLRFLPRERREVAVVQHLRMGERWRSGDADAPVGSADGFDIEAGV